MNNSCYCPGFNHLKELQSFSCACPSCGGEIEVFSDELERKQKCPHCKSLFEAKNCVLEAAGGSAPGL